MSNTAKLIIAFFLGLAVALGSAFLFMRSSPQAAAAVAAAPPPAPVVPSIGAPPSVPAPLSEPAPVSEHHAKKPFGVAKDVRKPEPAISHPDLAPQPAASADSPNRQAAASVASAAPPPPPASQPVFTPAPAAAPAPQPHTITLQSGTVLSVRLNDTLDTSKNSSGDTFRATLTSPLVVDGFVIADRGSRVQGQVVSADRAGRVKGRASLTLALSEINTTDGQRVRVQTDSFNREASASKGSDAAKVAAGAGLGALIGGLAGGGKGAGIGAGAGGAAGTGVMLGTRGKEVTLPTETALTFRLASPITITEQFRN